jgi:opacity protein-like surface antigen
MNHVSFASRGSALVVAAMVASLAMPDAARAQRFISLGGFEVRGGVPDLEDLENGVNYAFDIDMGYLFTPPLRTYIRFEGFRGDLDFTGGGTLNAAGIETGVRYDLLPTFFVSPYGVVGVNVSNIRNNDVSDQTAPVLPDGYFTSFAYGAGAALHLGQRLAITVDVRRLTGDRNVERTMYSLGVRLMMKGLDAYKP